MITLLKRLRYPAVTWSLIALGGCGAAVEEMPPGPTEPPVAQCTAPVGHAISDMQSVVNWVNALPKPVSLPCFVQSLPRPLLVYTTLGGVSAQPAIGSARPRVFIFIDQMILSVVPGEAFATLPDGTAKQPNADDFNRLELSYATQGIASIKGELRFPVKQNLPDNAPYDFLEYAPGHSTCGLCHRAESVVGNVNGVNIFQSDRKIPRDFQHLSIARNEYALCDRAADAYHCNMMDALFAHGPVVWQEFPENLQGHF